MPLAADRVDRPNAAAGAPALDARVRPLMAQKADIVHFQFHCPRGDWNYFASLIEACFLIAWDDNTASVSWHDECSVEVQVAPADTDISQFKPCVSPGKFLAWRPKLISTIAEHYAPLFATEIDAKGAPLADQEGAAIVDIERPGAPSAHEVIMAAELLRAALADAGFADQEITQLLGDPFNSPQV